jgi:hypothetical protein
LPAGQWFGSTILTVATAMMTQAKRRKTLVNIKSADFVSFNIAPSLKPACVSDYTKFRET